MQPPQFSCRESAIVRKVSNQVAQLIGRRRNRLPRTHNGCSLAIQLGCRCTQILLKQPEILLRPETQVLEEACHMSPIYVLSMPLFVFRREASQPRRGDFVFAIEPIALCIGEDAADAPARVSLCFAIESILGNDDAHPGKEILRPRLLEYASRQGSENRTAIQVGSLRIRCHSLSPVTFPLLPLMRPGGREAGGNPPLSPPVIGPATILRYYAGY